MSNQSAKKPYATKISKESSITLLFIVEDVGFLI